MMEFVFWFASNLVFEAFAMGWVINPNIPDIPGFGMWMQQHVDLEVSW